MKKLFASCCILFFSLSSIAQNYASEITEFNKFIIDKDIQWAQYDNDTVRFLSPDIRDLLINRMKKNEIKGYLSMRSGNDDELKIIHLTSEEIENNLPATMQRKTLHSGETDSAKFRDIQKDTIANGVINFYRILYVKNNKLYSLISRAAPMFSVVTTSGVYLGNAEYFQTALHTDLNDKPKKKDQVILLGSTLRPVHFENQMRNKRLKETFGRSLLDCIWPTFKKEKLKAITIEGKPLDYSPENSNLINQMDVPVYDSLGNLSGSTIIPLEIRPDMFSSVTITEDWFYNVSQNIFYTIIKDMTVFVEYLNDERSWTQRPSFKIIF